MYSRSPIDFSKLSVSIVEAALCLLIILLSEASLFAQNTNRPASSKPPQAPNPTAKEAEPKEGEIAAAEAYLEQVKDNFLTSKIYTLAGTDRTTVMPEIADALITTGKDADRLQIIAEKVLKFHKLDTTAGTLLFEDEKPRVFTYKLRTISFSTGIFALLTDDEAAALIAHEAGHLYAAKEMAEARSEDDDRLARINELKCDVIALLTLKNLGIDPFVLMTALTKLTDARRKMGLQTETPQSPALADRERLARIFIAKMS